MNKAFLIRFCFASVVILTGATVLVTVKAANSGEGFFEKMGDGWRKGKWVPGIPNVKPKTWEEVVFPICWGSPQDCRDTAKKSVEVKSFPKDSPLFSAYFRVDCKDKHNGKPRGDSTVTYISTISIEDAENKIMEAYVTKDLCQIDPDYLDDSRIMVLGSGKFLDT
jgi:hypothetical protein